MPTFQADGGPRPPGSSRCNSVSPPLGEFVTSHPSPSDSVVSLSVGDDYRNIGRDRYLHDDPPSQRKNIQRRDRQGHNNDHDKIYCDPQPPLASSDRCVEFMSSSYPDIYAIERIEDDTENIFAFKPPTTAEMRVAEHGRGVQIPVAAVLVPQNGNGNMADQFDLTQLREHDLRTLVNYPTSPPRAAFHGHGASPSSVQYSFSDSYCKSSTLRTSRLYNSSGTPSEDHKSFQNNRSSKQTRKTRRDPFDEDGNENDRARNSVASFEFETDSFDEESLKRHSWSFNKLDDSPYPEVRAAVSNVDDPDMPVLTFRMWLIGLTLCCISAGLNTYLNFRFPAPTIVPLVLVLIAHPFGKFLAYGLPITAFRIPSWLSRWCEAKEFSFNPGPWNIKEHACVYLMANVSITPAYSINTTVVAEQFYKVKLGIGFDLALILATQLIGFGLAGLVRRFLVWPASMIWPSNLVVCTLLNTLHAEEDAYSSSICRYKFFTIATCAAFFYYFLPGFLFQALSVFSYVCWIAPDNVVINQLFGIRSGLGMGILTFDWSMISFLGSPLMIPWWAQVHTAVGFVLFFWILAPILYYTNFWNLARFPMASNIPYDITGHPYNITRIVTSEHTLDVNAYANYSPLYLPATYTIAYLITFALSTCVLTHTVLYYGKSVLDNIKNVKSAEEEDVHARLMKRYPDVPNLWYAACFLIFFSIGVVSVRAWPTGMPVWALTLCTVLSMIYLLPSGFIYATTGQTVSLNFPGEIIPGVLFPGNPLVNMIFKAYSVQTLAGALSFVQNLKLGHYVKTPPRASFLVQVISTVLASFVQVFVKEWMFDNIHDLCSPSQKDLLTCPRSDVYYTASVIWGLIGPGKQLGEKSIYRKEVYALIIGLFAPIPLWYWRRRYPDTRLPLINLPVLLNGSTYIPPATGINYSSWFTVGFIFQYVIRTRRFSWWSKFNYILSAALDSGTALSICAVFLFLQLPHGGFSLNWVGNTVFTKTADWNSASLIPPS